MSDGVKVSGRYVTAGNRKWVSGNGVPGETAEVTLKFGGVKDVARLEVTPQILERLETGGLELGDPVELGGVVDKYGKVILTELLLANASKGPFPAATTSASAPVGRS
jgi:hypothetical protein